MQLTRIAIIGAVAAGTPSEWIPLEKWRMVRPLAGARPGEHIYGLEVVGHSLVGKNILDGDILIFIHGRRAQPGDLCVVQTPHGLTAKFVCPNAAGEITLQGANDLIPDQVWLSEDIRIIGVVQRVERDLH